MVLIPALLYLALRSSSVQTYLARQATEYLSRELDTKIEVGGVNISWFLNIVLEDISILDKHDQQLLFAKRLVVDVKRISPADQLLWVNKLVFDQAHVGAAIYEDEENFNFDFITDYFSNDTPRNPDRPNWDVTLHSLEFRNSGLTFKDHNKKTNENGGFDYSDFAFNDLQLTLNDIFYENDTLQASLNHFSVVESKGLSIQNIKADLLISPNGSNARNLLIRTRDTRLEVNADFSYDGYQAFSDFANQVTFNLEITPSLIDLYEVGYFVPNLYGMKDKLLINGMFSGQLSNLRAREVGFRYGLLSEFKGNFTAIGLPIIDETFLNFSVENFITSKQDIETFRLPASSSIPRLQLPDELLNLGMASFSGNFTGFIYDFVAYGTFKTSLGNISTDIAVVSNHDYSSVSYSGNLSTRGFDIGTLAGRKAGMVSLNTRIKGSGLQLNTLNLEMTGRINSLDLLSYTYKNIDISGQFSNNRFNGNLLIDDPNIFMNFVGLIDLQKEIPELNFSAHIDKANLAILNIWQRDSLYHDLFSTSITVNGKGKNLNLMEGNISAYETVILEIPLDDHNEAKEFRVQNLSLKNSITGDNQKLMQFTSDFADASLEGTFNPEDIMYSAQEFLSYFAPARFHKEQSNTSNGRNGNGNGRYAQDLKFEVMIKNPYPVTNFFIPELQISPQASVQGKWNTYTRNFSMIGRARYVSLNSLNADNIEVKAHTQEGTFNFETYSSKVYITDSISVNHFKSTGVLGSDSLQFLVNWNNHSSTIKNTGHIEGTAQFMSPWLTKVHFQPSQMYINDSLWSIGGDNQILIDSNLVDVKNFYAFKKNESLRIDGILSNRPEDVFNIELDNFNIESLAFLLQDRKLDFDGIASGKLSISTPGHSPNITANLLIRDFAFNKDHLGDLEIASNWDAREKAFKIETSVIYYGNVGTNRPIVASGYFYPDRDKDNFDLDITIENLKMSIFSRYVDGFASNFRGLASGRLRLDGPMTAPELSGKARLVRTGFKIDYLNTAYTFAHEVEIGKDYFSFDNLILNDTLGNRAIATGIIRHNNFFNFFLDINMRMERIIALNTHAMHNDLFYGKGFASGLVHVHGPVDNIVLNISAHTNRGTQIFLPLDYQGELTESNFITFVTPENLKAPILIPKSELAGITMNFDLTVTPDSEIQLIFDSKIGDILRGRGSGNLKFEITPQGAFYMYGDYLIDDGDYLFTLQNIINKRFRIQQGGMISWSGDPYDAEIDLKAIYRTRTSLADLAMSTMQGDTSEIYRRRIPVETVLHLQEKLFNPTVSFDIQIPGGDEQSREMISRMITTEQEMNRQVFSLLLLNRFTPNPTEYNTALGYGVGSTSFELLSNQLSNWLSQISSDFDIGINYRPGDEISSQELEVALSTQFFHDRVTIDGNVGVAGNHPASQRTSNIIGDVVIEVKITPEGKFRLKAFNRSNTFDVINTNSPYTQGIGVFYRKEFDNLSDIFRRQRRAPINEQLDQEPEREEYQEVEAIQFIPTLNY
jgi:hypothetical protein